MKDTFHGWSSVKDMDIDQVSDLIVTGRKTSEAKPDAWLYQHVGHALHPLTVLDFGCGFGRNSFGLANHSGNWNVIAYDNDAMLSKVPLFASINYDGSIPKNLWFLSDWNQIELHKFDRILCSLVLQHIYEDALIKYVNSFKKMTRKLIVVGRRFNDDKNNRSTWTILEEQGLIPIEFYAGNSLIPYMAKGDPNDHNLAVYTL